jgi:hypothetical protein
MTSVWCVVCVTLKKIKKSDQCFSFSVVVPSPFAHTFHFWNNKKEQNKKAILVAKEYIYSTTSKLNNECPDVLAIASGPHVRDIDRAERYTLSMILSARSSPRDVTLEYMHQLLCCSQSTHYLHCGKLSESL